MSDSENASGCGCVTGPYGLFLLLFIAIKVAGTSLAAWSWWWLLLPIVPLLGLLVTKMGL